MKNILISCISLFSEKKMYVNGELKKPIGYSSENITINAYQTNEACAKFLIKKFARSGEKLDVFIRVQSNSVVNNESGFTMRYLDNSIEDFCGSEELPKPQNHDCFLGDDEQAHRYDRVLSEISETVRAIAAGKPKDMGIYLDMAGGKRDNYIFIQLLTKLLSFYGYQVHTYYADITGDEGAIVNTDLSFDYMKIIDAVNDFVLHGSAALLQNCIKNADNDVDELLQAMVSFSDSIQLCSTSLNENIRDLEQKIENVEKNVSGSSGDFFIIKTMLPLIRDKFHLSQSGSTAILGIIRWCLENDLIQQALTIYNENAANIIIDNAFVDVRKQEEIKKDLDRRKKTGNKFERNRSKINVLLSETYTKMSENLNIHTKKMKKALGTHSQQWFNDQTLDTKRAIASLFFHEKFLSYGIGITLKINYILLRHILSDYYFVTSARNRVNHASDRGASRAVVGWMSSKYLYHFSSYTYAFTPKNIKEDMLRAVKNLEDALKKVNNG